MRATIFIINVLNLMPFTRLYGWIQARLAAKSEFCSFLPQSRCCHPNFLHFLSKNRHFNHALGNPYHKQRNIQTFYDATHPLYWGKLFYKTFWLLPITKKSIFMCKLRNIPPILYLKSRLIKIIIHIFKHKSYKNLF